MEDVDNNEECDGPGPVFALAVGELDVGLVVVLEIQDELVGSERTEFGRPKPPPASPITSNRSSVILTAR